MIKYTTLAVTVSVAHIDAYLLVVRDSTVPRSGHGSPGILKVASFTHASVAEESLERANHCCCVEML